MDEVSRWVRTLGVRVVRGSLGGLQGGYMIDHHAVMIEDSLAPIQYRSTIMHELGHAYFGHAHTTPHAERQAGEWSARAMIRFCEFSALTRVHDTTQAVACEMGVLPRDVANYAVWVGREFSGPIWADLD